MIRMERAPRSAEPLSLALADGRLPLRAEATRSSSAPSRSTCARCSWPALGTLFPIFARDILKTGPWGLGLLRAAPAVGALIMSVMLARRPLTLPIGPVLFGVVAVFGLATVVFGLSTNLILSLSRAGSAWRCRRRQRGDPLLAGPAPHPAGDARPGQRRERHVHRHVQLSRRFPGRRGGGADRRAARRRPRRGRRVPVLALWLFLFPQLRRIRSLDEVPSHAGGRRSRAKP